MENLIKGFYDGLRPPRRMKPSEWADEFRVLSSKASAEPGRWNTDRTPYLREIMDNFDPYSPVQEVVFMKGAQIGATEILYNVMAFYIDVNPGPILSVMPTEGTAQKNTKIRFNPMVEACPTLREKIGAKTSRKSSNTMAQKDFPGGVIVFGGANSAASLRSLPIKVLLLDEIDAYPTDLDGEGSPVELAKARTSTFEAGRKIAYVSTPTDEDTSLVAAYFEDSDQRFYHVPCPHCGTFQKLVWERIVYDSTARRIPEAHYQCEACDELIEERHKPKMLAAGMWVPEKPELVEPTRRGYHLSSLYSPYGWKSWTTIARQYEAAERENSPEKRKVFVNTVLGQTVKHKSVVPKPQRLFDRAGGYARGEVPNEVGLITVGADVQKDRIEAEIVGWGRNSETWSIDYVVIHGDPTQQQVWSELTRLLYRTWETPDKRVIGVSKLAVDSGYLAQQVYNWCRQHSPGLVMAVKGQDNTKQSTILRSSQAVDVNANGAKITGVGLWTLGVDLLKTEVYTRLNTELDGNGGYPTGYCHFPDGYQLDYYKMLCAERNVTRKDNKGFDRSVWEKIQARNEALDCRVYARAAAHLVGIDRWEDSKWDAEFATAFAPEMPARVRKSVAGPEPEVTPSPVKPAKQKRNRESIWA